MKGLDRFNLVLFSILILVISLVICLLLSGWFSLDMAVNGIKLIVTHALIRNISLGASIILILLAMKSIFYNSYSKEKNDGKEGILLENDNGKLLVSRDTVESLTNTVVKSFDSAEVVTTKVEVDQESNIRIYVTLFVHPDAVIKDLSNKVQTNIKETIKKSLDLNVAEVNIRIKNVSTKKEPNIKE